jgi:carnitine O-acetyltransferase
MLLARSINPSAPTLFHAPLSPRAKAYKPPRSSKPSLPNTNPTIDTIDTTPKKLEWKLTPELRVGVRYAETRLSALICQNECQALEFDGYGKAFITSHGISPDVFVQMAFQAAYFGLYGACFFVGFCMDDILILWGCSAREDRVCVRTSDD